MPVVLRVGFPVATGLAALALSLATPAAAIVPVGDPAAGLRALNELNLIVLGELHQGGHSIGGAVFTGGAGSDQLERDLSAASRELQAMESAATLAGAGFDQAVLHGSGDGSGVSVFNLTDEIFGFQEISLAPDALHDMVVINVTGSGNPVWDGWLTDGFSTAAANIIWNFSGFDSLTIGNDFFGSILAPQMNLSTMADLTGSVAVHHMEMGGDIYPGSYQPDAHMMRMAPPESGLVPEPQTWVMLIAGFLFVGLSMRRQARRLAD